MTRKLSSIAPDWWDYTTLDSGIIDAAARLTPAKMLTLSRPGFKVVFQPMENGRAVEQGRHAGYHLIAEKGGERENIQGGDQCL